jgi:hypothetical protein
LRFWFSLFFILIRQLQLRLISGNIVSASIADLVICADLVIWFCGAAAKPSGPTGVGPKGFAAAFLLARHIFCP